MINPILLIIIPKPIVAATGMAINKKGQRDLSNPVRWITLMTFISIKTAITTIRIIIPIGGPLSLNAFAKPSKMNGDPIMKITNTWRKKLIAVHLKVLLLSAFTNFNPNFKSRTEKMNPNPTSIEYVNIIPRGIFPPSCSMLKIMFNTKESLLFEN